MAAAVLCNAARRIFKSKMDRTFAFPSLIDLVPFIDLVKSSVFQTL